MSFLPKLTGGQRKGDEQASNNNTVYLRYNTLSKSTRPGSILPSIKPSIGAKFGIQSADNASQYYTRLYNLKTVLEWYQTWQPWQQKVLLDGVIERLSVLQLETISSTLEPVFHRDFRLSLFSHYPPSALKQGSLDARVLERKIWDTFYSALIEKECGGVKGLYPALPLAAIESQPISCANTETIGDAADVKDDVINQPASELLTNQLCDSFKNSQGARESSVVTGANGEQNISLAVKWSDQANDQAEDASTSQPIDSPMKIDLTEELPISASSKHSGDGKKQQLSKPLGPEILPDTSAVLTSSAPGFISISGSDQSMTTTTSLQYSKGENSSSSGTQMTTSASIQLSGGEQSRSFGHVSMHPDSGMRNESVGSQLSSVGNRLENSFNDGQIEGETSVRDSEVIYEVGEQSAVISGLEEEAVLGPAPEVVSMEQDGNNNTVSDLSGDECRNRDVVKDGSCSVDVVGTDPGCKEEDKNSGQSQANLSVTLESFAQQYVKGIINDALNHFKSQLKAAKKKMPKNARLKRTDTETSEVFHRIRSILNLDSNPKLDFFGHARKSRLGSMRREVPYNCRRSLLGSQDMLVPVQKSFKAAKWWTQPEKGHKLISANKRVLNKHFQAQVDQVYSWLEDMESHECLTLVVDMVKSSCAEVVNYLAKSLSKRLHQDGDINLLHDRTLFYIFTMLNTEDLKSVRLVCRRWRYLCDREELWMSKLYLLGKAEGVENLLIDVLDLHELGGIDWKQAFLQAEKVSIEAKAKRLGATGTGSDIKFQRDKSVHWKERERSSMAKSRTVSSKSQLSPLKRDATEFAANLDSSPLSDLNKQPLRLDLAPSNLHNCENEADIGHEELTNFKPARDLTGNFETTSTLDFQAHQDPDKVKFMRFAGYLYPLSAVKKLEGHHDVVSCVRLCQRRIFSGSLDRTIRLWDIRSGRCIHKFYGHKGGIHCLQFDSTNLYSGSWDTTVMVWDLVTFKRRAILTGHSRCVSCLAVGDKYLISGSHDSTIRVWYALTFTVYSVITTEASITCLEFDGSCIISGDTSFMIHIHDVSNGSCLRRLVGHESPLCSILLSHNLVISSDDDGMLFFWDKNTTDGCPAAAIQAHPLAVNGLDFKDGRFYTASSDGIATEWDLITMTGLRHLVGHSGAVRDIKVLGKRMVTCSDDGYVQIWEAKPVVR